jgi:hypothetical protein
LDFGGGGGSSAPARAPARPALLAQPLPLSAPQFQQKWASLPVSSSLDFMSSTVMLLPGACPRVSRIGARALTRARADAGSVERACAARGVLTIASGAVSPTVMKFYFYAAVRAAARLPRSDASD